MTRTERLMQAVDEFVIRVTDHMPSTRVLGSVLAASMATLLFLAVTDGKSRGVHTTPDSEAPVTASAGLDNPAAPAPSQAAVTPRRLEPAVGVAPVVQPPAVAPVRVMPAASAAVEPLAQPMQRIEIRRSDAPPRVIDMARSAPVSSRAAEIVRADPPPPRVPDVPRPDTAVGATSRASVENTLSSGPARSREVALEATPSRDESTKASLDARPAAERAPASEPAGGSATGL